jgi:Tfp pilus assembly protein PilE
MFKINLKNKNKMKILIITTISFIVGVILTVFTYQALTIYQLRTQIANDHATLTQVVDFLNQNIQQAQKGTATQTPTTQQTTTSTKK